MFAAGYSKPHGDVRTGSSRIISPVNARRKFQPLAMLALQPHNLVGGDTLQGVARVHD